MAQTVWKYELPIGDDIWVQMPIGAQPISLMMQREQLCLWARVDPSASVERRLFKLRGTGHQVGRDCGKHIGSVQMADGDLVFHLFEAV